MKTIRRTHTVERTEDGFVVLSTETPCPQDGLILPAGGWDLSRIRESVALKMFYGHDTWAFPIGRWDDVQVRDNKLIGRPVFAADEDPGRAGIAAKLWDGGFLDDVSVSFSCDPKLMTGPIPGDDGRSYMVSGKHTLREASVVGIGADQNAGKGRLAEAVAAGAITRAEADAFAPDPNPQAPPAGGREPHGNVSDRAADNSPHAHEVHALRAALEAMRAELDRLREMIERAASPAAPAADPSPQSTDPAPEPIPLDMDAIRTAARESVQAAVRRTVENVLRGRLPD